MFDNTAPVSSFDQNPAVGATGHYAEIYQRVMSGEVLSQADRYEYGHEFVQRYHKRVLSKEEQE